MESIKRKFAYLLLQITFKYAYTVAYFYSLLHKRRKSGKAIKKVAAIWYNPSDLTGSNLRQGYWKKLFEEKGIQYDNFHVGSIAEVSRYLDRGSWVERYKFYRINLLRRLKQFYQLKGYDVIWLDRGFVTYYPLKRAFFERCLKRMTQHLVIDSTDGSDYESNPQLVLDTMGLADRITVGFKYLEKFYKERFDDVVQFNWTIPDEMYHVKKEYKIDGLPVIGWMGSPGNFVHVKKIEGQLRKVAKEVPFKLVYICREEQELDIPGAEIEHHLFGDDYYDILAKFDIGISPCIGDTIALKGKIAMKHQEFLLSGTPQVCSPVAISEYVEDGKEAFLVPTMEAWPSALISLMKDGQLREKMGKSARELFQEHYLYEKEFPKIFNALTKF